MSDILVVIGEGEERYALDDFFHVLETKGGHHIQKTHSRLAGDHLETGIFDMLIIDNSVNELGMREMLSRMAEQFSETRCIMLTNDGYLGAYSDIIEEGAVECIKKPASPEDLLSIVEKIVPPGTLSVQEKPGSFVKRKNGFESLIGESVEIKKVFGIIEKVANTESTVLITGESGTGKELIARAIHEKSNRSRNPMIVINCGAIPGELLESELFGHEKGAFTGAHRTRIGRFEMANGSTIFLDEIGDMSPSLQVKLLRVLQEQSFERVGGTKTLTVDIRVLAATNKDLSASIKDGAFREDLYYRLNVIPIKVAPLRERKHDIPLLVHCFQKKLYERRGHAKKTFSDQAMAMLMRYPWPGNIRELENLMERLYVLIDHDVIQISDLPKSFRTLEPVEEETSTGTQALFTLPEDGFGFNEAVEKFQKDLILQALNQANWVKAKAAELLKMNRTTLVEKIKKMKIEPEEMADL